MKHQFFPRCMFSFCSRSGHSHMCIQVDLYWGWLMVEGRVNLIPPPIASPFLLSGARSSDWTHVGFYFFIWLLPLAHWGLSAPRACGIHEGYPPRCERATKASLFSSVETLPLTVDFSEVLQIDRECLSRWTGGERDRVISSGWKVVSYQTDTRESG